MFSLYLFISISIERAMMHFQKEISFRLPQHLVLKEGANFCLSRRRTVVGLVHGYNPTVRTALS